tara:strand:- start:70955 stop:71281 length:327 start_codon:yes stop_codon:yes gene_type:complete
MAYIRYNIEMKRPTRPPWFKARNYGWGWVPVTWQGWLITLIFVLAYLLVSLLYLSWMGEATKLHALSLREVSLSTVEYVAAMTLLSYALIRICTHYGEKPGWHWGERD